MKIPCLLCLVFFFFACESQPSAPKPTHVGFYYWQTTWQWNRALQNHYEKLGAKELYVRFFDLDWNENTGKVVPVAPLQEGKTAIALPATAQITPTVFITNRAMYHLPDAEVEKVAEKIYQKIKAQWQAIFPALPALQGIQLDCDWSGETREKFFKLCKVLKQKIAPAQLSATIRLHQIKYAAKTGIPPIDKGVLMCYNMGKMNGDNTQNSILDIDILQSYAPALPKYPLPLDIALPTFAWGVLKREGRVINLLNNISIKDFQSPNFIAGKRNTWRVAKGHYLGGIYLYEGDEIRFEQISENLLQKAKETLQPYLQGRQYAMIFYHLHSKIGEHFSSESLQKLAFD